MPTRETPSPSPGFSPAPESLGDPARVAGGERAGCAEASAPGLWEPECPPRLRRLMLRFLQKRKFRLVTRWKAALKENLGVQLPEHVPFPYALIFRAFDEMIRLLKLECPAARASATESLLAGLPPSVVPTSDHFMELFLSGRDVMGEFVGRDASFGALFGEPGRQQAQGALERTFKYLIDREMGEHSRRSLAGMKR